MIPLTKGDGDGLKGKGDETKREKKKSQVGVTSMIFDQVPQVHVV